MSAATSARDPGRGRGTPAELPQALARGAELTGGRPRQLQDAANPGLAITPDHSR
ncbi:hypothetical protein [Nonomuraea diastatica]|uniref:hypothetical protein n=1 Tax=Nonomuraea diastatica TaxID=1848329 RepID=UPI0014089745|nr:hypothetical protein [Nonomuraea diastatica]